MIKHFRSYEVSIWTLQDSFITVLKPSNLEPKGQIQNPIMNIKDDGENSLSFKIPMYLHENNAFKENPIWYNTRNGTIIAGMRKIKVIYNKGIKDVEKVFEFLITDVKEEHEGFSRYCSVTCEGLAFHELGKQGYRISLEGADEILAAQQEWADSGKTTRKPEARITYWCDRIFENSNWNYSVQMDWSGHDGIVNDHYQVGNNEYYGKDYSSMNNASRLVYNNQREEAHLRRRDTVYEDSFVSAWKTEDDELIPESVYTEREKFRLVEAKESNIYNLSQTIAELFQVFCRYEYKYDDNYHIIGREAILYNNFLQEEKGVVDFTYYYNTSSLSREMDCSDLCSKMFVLPLNDADMLSGETTIMDTEANKSLEDYIFNFDYLYDIGTVNEEQYKAIGEHEKELRELNKELIESLDDLYNAQNELIEVKASRDNAEKMVTGAIEAQNDNNRLREQLIVDGVADENGLIEAHQMLTLIEDSSTGRYYVNIRQLGVQGNTLKLFKTRNTTTNDFEDEFFNFVREYDDSGNLVKITHISKSDIPEGERVIYGIFKYSPKLYYDNIINTYRSVQATNQGIYNNAVDKVNELEGIIDTCESNYKTLLAKKQSKIKAFERLMGPALREGTWQPEDEYANYGDFYSEKGSLGQKISDILSLIWDSQLFDDEQKNYYIYGVEAKKHYYPCIDLSTVIGSFANNPNYFSRLAFIYDDYLLDDNGNPLSEYNGAPTYYFIGSKMLLHFVKVGNTVKPVLIITGMENLSERQLKFIIDSRSNARLSVVSIGDNGAITDTPILTSLNWLVTPERSYSEAGSLEITSVYPRFEIKSDRVKSASTDILVRKINSNNEVEKKYEIYEDYYILYRDREYFVTLKPEVIFAAGELNATYNIDYTISEAALAVYLDAVKVLKENAYPKVSYNIDLYSIDNKFVYDSYNRLGQIAHINDPDLKFQNVMGYISELSLDLDKPQNDKATIKNYKTKFEDLFSNIVAQTEEMKKNSYMFDVMSDAFNSSGNLSDDVFNNILERLPDDDSGVIDPATEYSKYEPYLRTELRQLFTQAGQIMIDAQDTIEDVGRLNLINSDILSSFTEDVAGKLASINFIDDENNCRIKEKDRTFGISFKTGDVWEHTIENELYNPEEDNGEPRYITNIYVATVDSDDVDYPSNFNDIDKLQSLKGWTLTYDGSLAGITGASITVDAAQGYVDITAEKLVSIKSSGDIYLGANNDITVLANNTLNISGSQINVTSRYDNKNNFIDGGIKVVTVKEDKLIGNKTSFIEMKGEGLTVAAHDGIKMMSGSELNFYTSDNADTSVVSIGKDTGIFVGSTKPVVFFSGGISKNTIENFKTTSDYSKLVSAGASALISSEQILFGISSGSNTTAVRLTDNHIVLGAGNAIDTTNIRNDSDIGSSVSGVYISKDAIKMATGDNNNRSYISLTGQEVKIANANNESNGAFVTISQAGVKIGTSTEVADYNTAQMKTTNKGGKFEVYAPNFIVDSNGHLYAYGANIAGTVRASNGEIGGFTIGNSSIYKDKSSFDAVTNGVYLGTDGIALGGSNFKVNNEGYLIAKSGEIGGWSFTGTELTTTSGEYDISIFGNINSSDNKVIAIGKTLNSSLSDAFYIKKDGSMLAQDISVQNITASNMTIGKVSFKDMWYITGEPTNDGMYVKTTTSTGSTYINFNRAQRFKNYNITTNNENAIIDLTVAALNVDGNIITSPNSYGYIKINLDGSRENSKIKVSSPTHSNPSNAFSFITQTVNIGSIYTDGITDANNNIEIKKESDSWDGYTHITKFKITGLNDFSLPHTYKDNLSGKHTEWYNEGKNKAAISNVEFSDNENHTTLVITVKYINIYNETLWGPDNLTFEIKSQNKAVDIKLNNNAFTYVDCSSIYNSGWQNSANKVSIPIDYDSDNTKAILIKFPDKTNPDNIGSLALYLEKDGDYVYCKNSGHKIAKIKIN